MRVVTILLAVASLSACHESSGQKVGAPAALTFDGATGDAAAIRAHGERLSHIMGCRGCHDANLQGRWFNDDQPAMGRLYASNLTRLLTGVIDLEPGITTPDLDIAGAYSDAELATLLTTGKGRMPRDLGLMTLVGNGHFAFLTARERSAIIA